MIYLDFSATTPLLPAVKKELLRIMELDLGNPSSLHSAGQTGKSLLNRARSEVAQLIEARPQSVIFTSGGSESNNTVIRTFEGCPIFVSAIEHPSVLHPAEAYGAPCTKIPVNQQGIIDINFLQTELEKTIIKDPKQKILVSVMLANNETGTIEPVAEVAQLIQDLKKSTHTKIYLHTDATQAVGKIPVSVKALNCDYLTFTSHKLGGPVGIAALYIRPGSPFKPLIMGGAQENKRRAGTSNVLLASGFKVAAQEAKKNLNKYQEVAKLRDYLAKEIKKKIPSAKIITPIEDKAIGPFELIKENSRISGGDYERARSMAGATRSASRSARLVDDGNQTEFFQARKEPIVCLPNILNISFPAAEGESTQLYLDLENIEVSTGSACASGDLEPSHVLMAMYHDAEIAHGSVRFSFGLTTTRAEIDELLAKLPPIIAKIQDLSTIKQGKS
ncbi:cysteine desulfurase [Candidatus Saccharibacteria bacterium]|nr:cysteine desulfurase [Candidatus Saccharibacteria bacterium]MBR6122842.1 cysteine desulfurase [Candidatus Saccharibacteria bacterium]